MTVRSKDHELLILGEANRYGVLDSAKLDFQADDECFHFMFCSERGVIS